MSKGPVELTGLSMEEMGLNPDGSMPHLGDEDETMGEENLDVENRLEEEEKQKQAVGNEEDSRESDSSDEDKNAGASKDQNQFSQSGTSKQTSNRGESEGIGAAARQVIKDAATEVDIFGLSK